MAEKEVFAARVRKVGNSKVITVPADIDIEVGERLLLAAKRQDESIYKLLRYNTYTPLYKNDTVSSFCNSTRFVNGGLCANA